MKTLTLTIPDGVDISKDEVLRMMASHLYDRGKLSLGHAAELCNMDKREFLKILGNYNISVFGETMEEIRNDVEQG